MNLFRVVLVVLASFSMFRGFSQDTELYHTILKLDSAFFHAYNTCDLAKQSEFYSHDIEFYHDKSGLDTSKQRILENTKKYICGKVTRELVQGSLEVSPLPGYGAVALGMHMFHNNQEKHAKLRPSRFLIIWKNSGDKWQITKVISLH